jgi:acetyltransferase
VPRAPLDVFFSPRSVALIGATDKAASVGQAILANLLANSFGGPVYAVNPNRTTVMGLPCFPEVAAIPGEVDLAVIVIPAPAVPAAVRQCAAKGVRGAVVISAGFRETGPRGLAMEQEMRETARAAGMRLIGPNCVGVMNPHSGLNATFAASMARPGHVALVSQSGAICTAILDWSLQEKVGFSAFVSTGSMAETEWGDLIRHLGADPHTRSIIAYMESVPDAGSFVAAARQVARTKPIIVLKPGRTEAAARAAASHTGALTGRDDVLDAAFERSGVVRVDTIAELFNLAEALDKQPLPRGPRLTMVTNAGGAGVLAADALLGAGGELAVLAPETIERLNAVLPAHWSHGNPVDILGDADYRRFEQAVEIVAADPATDGLLVTLSPQSMTDPTEVARAMTRFARLAEKPLLACWMGGVATAAGMEVLNNARIPTYRYPDAAARVFQGMWRHSLGLRVLEECPLPPAKVADHPVIAAARARGRSLLSEAESKQLLADAGIPTMPTRIARSEDEAVAAANETGFPVAVKLHSETVTHKSDVGAVWLNVADADAVRDAWRAIRAAVSPEHFLGVTVQPMIRAAGYELILGSTVDAQFGPVVMFGGGGVLVEVYKDRAVGLPPLNAALARQLIDRTRIARALHGVRGRPPVDLAALEEILVRFSYLVCEQRWIQEIDINPLLAAPGQLLALDARVILYPPDTPQPVFPALLPC